MESLPRGSIQPCQGIVAVKEVAQRRQDVAVQAVIRKEPEICSGVGVVKVDLRERGQAASSFFQGSSVMVEGTMDLEANGAARTRTTIGRIAFHRGEGECAIVPTNIFSKSPRSRIGIWGREKRILVKMF